MINELSQAAKKRMEDALNSLKRDLDGISTGRANPHALDPIKTEVYGSFMPITQLASVSTPDAATLTVQVWDKENVKAIEKAIINANLGFNPMVDGQLIRINIPKLSEERRKELGKLAKKYGEDKKIAMRNIRRDILDDFKKHEESAVSKDQAHGFSDIVQKITDEYTHKVDELVHKKETDLLKV